MNTFVPDEVIDVCGNNIVAICNDVYTPQIIITLVTLLFCSV